MEITGHPELIGGGRKSPPCPVEHQASLSRVLEAVLLTERGARGARAAGQAHTRLCWVFVQPNKTLIASQAPGWEYQEISLQAPGLGRVALQTMGLA